MYELFDHTADVGLRVVSDDLETLFREAAEGLFSLVVERIPRRGPARELEFRLEADRIDHLLFDWLNELLYQFDGKGMLLDAFEVAIDGLRLRARAAGRPLDVERDELLREVKAITYHGLRVERTPGGWLAEVILDI